MQIAQQMFSLIISCHAITDRVFPLEIDGRCGIHLNAIKETTDWTMDTQNRYIAILLCEWTPLFVCQEGYCCVL